MSQAAEVLIPQTMTLMRSRLYKLLSLGYRYPDAEIFESFQSGKFMAAVWDCIAFIPHLKPLAEDKERRAETMRCSQEGGGLLDFEVGYNQTFEVGPPEPPCPPYEGLVRSEESRTALMMELADFYRHFGLQMNQTVGLSELPDHICSELEFLHFLTYKEAQARHENKDELMLGYILAQKDFLERHPIKWLSQFSARLAEYSTVPFYAALGRITSETVSWDFMHVTDQLKPLSH